MTIRIRRALPTDGDAIFAVHAAAFPTLAEARLVAALDAAGDALLSLVAEDGAAIVAHLLLSRVEASAGQRVLAAAALAPVAVMPARQYRGIGSALVDAALAEAAEEGIDYVFVVGDPGFYERFGFDPAIGGRFASPYAGPYWMGLALGDAPLPKRGEVRHAGAFAASGAVGHPDQVPG